MKSEDIAYFADATLIVPPPHDNPKRPRTSFLHIATPQPHNANNAPPLRAMTLPITSANDDTDHIANPDLRLSLQGSFHGTNHDVVVIVFSNAKNVLIGAAILYRDPGDES